MQINYLIQKKKDNIFICFKKIDMMMIHDNCTSEKR